MLLGILIGFFIGAYFMKWWMKTVYIIVVLIYGGITGWLSYLTFTSPNRYYRLNCDTTKYGYMWITDRALKEEGFTCLNSKQELWIETNPIMIKKLDALNLK